MKEFVLRRTDREFLVLPSVGYEELLRPDSVPSEPIRDREVYGISVAQSVLTFSVEDFGLHLVFEESGLSDETAQTIVNEIAAKLEAAGCGPIVVVQTS